MASEKFDIVVFGATGFTGQYVVEEIARTIEEESGLKWAIAGRSMQKLQKCLQEASQRTGKELEEIPILIADVKSDASLQEMCSKTKVVINCVGPYRFYGDPVVRACIENKTHHIDICGEPGVLEKWQLLYNSKAKEANIYLIESCGFDSIPSDMGVLYTKENFPGDLNSVEGYVAIQFGPDGGCVNSGTWNSAIQGFASVGETAKQRKQLYPTPMPKPQHVMKKRSIFYSDLVKGWCVPFQGSDKSVVYRTQRYLLEKNSERPVQFLPYLKIGSMFNLICMMMMGAVFGILANFKCGRYLLSKFPRLFSFGLFSDEGPTRKQVMGSSFSYTFIGEGYETKKSVEDKHEDKPTKKIVCKVSGPEPGYISTPICLVQATYVLLRETAKLPEGGGVFTPGMAFCGTSLIKRLKEHKVDFTVLES